MQPVFAVACLSDPFPTGKLAVTGGVFGFGEVSELFLWNSQQQARVHCPITVVGDSLGQANSLRQTLTCGLDWRSLS